MAMAPRAEPLEVLKEAYERLPPHVKIDGHPTQACYDLLVHSPPKMLDVLTCCLRACNAAGLPPRAQGIPAKDLLRECFAVYKEKVGERPIASPAAPPSEASAASKQDGLAAETSAVAGPDAAAGADVSSTPAAQRGESEAPGQSEQPPAATQEQRKAAMESWAEMNELLENTIRLVFTKAQEHLGKSKK
mmetsp:Transcript_63716/g.151875  ORF Transcript_63716/g.151875 Transcript_63716/m.151875 type:complete len:190 (-) Transcript_63716:131-700(-)